MTAKPPIDPALEQRLLRRSILAACVIAALNVTAGLVLRSQAILFDGLYTIIDIVMTFAALAVSGLIARGEDRRFQFGYWHLEPLLSAINGALLALSCAYALLNGARGLLSGGGEVPALPAAAVALVDALIALAMARYLARAIRGRASDLLRADTRAWAIGGAFGLGLALAFAGAGGADALWGGMLSRYADSLILVLLAVTLAPIPVHQLVCALRDILVIAPADLDASVARVAADVAARHGFVAHRSYVQKAGRGQFIEIGLLAPPDYRPGTLADLDRIRAEIAEGLGGLGPGRWLTVDFTADERWI